METTFFGEGRLAFVVDDQPDFCLAMEHLLATFGFRVACAADGIEALDKLEEIAPDVILLDLFMPRMDGLDLLRKLKSKGKPLPPTIAVTGDVRVAQFAARSAAQTLGARAVLLKPFNRDELGNALSFVLNVHKGSTSAI